MCASSAVVAVLAGGRGERLGGSKPGALLAGVPLIDYPLAAAAQAGLEAVVVAKRSSRLPRLRERILYEPEQPAHPLCGLISALAYAARQDAGTRARPLGVLGAACDMPFLTAPLLRWLAELDGAALVSVDGRPQPTLCRCEPGHLPALRTALQAGASLRRALATLKPRVVEEAQLRRFGEPRRLCFNVNTPGELMLAEDLLARPDPPQPHAAPRSSCASAPLSST